MRRFYTICLTSSLRHTPAAFAQSRACTKPAASKTKLGFSRFREVVALGVGKELGRVSDSPKLCGEDSFFVNQELMATLGVADGVGGWRSEGVDPGEIARGLMGNCDDLSGSKFSMPQWLLAEAYWKVKYGREVTAGSTTACIVAVREVQDVRNGPISLRCFTTNIGDSGYLIINPEGKVRHSSNPDTVGFNAPAQLAMIPPALQSKGFIDVCKRVAPYILYPSYGCTCGSTVRG